MNIRIISYNYLISSERSSTRLHAPPGGVSSISFGDDTPSQTKKPAAASKVSNNIFGQDEDPKPSTAGVRRQSAQSAMGGSAMADIFAENKQPAAAGRVKQHPGGNSSLVIG